MWGSAAKRLLQRQAFSVALKSKVSRRCVIDVVWLGFVCCLFSEIPSASSRVRHNRAAAAAQPLEFQVSRVRISQFDRSFLPSQFRIYNDLPCTVFDTGKLNGFKGAVNRWLLP